ncbi:MAG: endonuclease/exonuclease/phosphatase family protein [Gammaproteobacteria bacterium]|nr:endonuclease/exonuclease/phosphatase family protein [Gammaproteobacteria bacterium]
MQVRLMSWNMAGAKLFDQLDPEPAPAAGRYIQAFHKAWNDSIVPWLATPDKDAPDIILLQECIGFEDHSSSPSGRWQSGNEILSKIFSGYQCFFFPAVTSHDNPHPGKWSRYTNGNAVANPVPTAVDIQQGYGICVREGIISAKLWTPWPDPQDAPPDADQANGECTSCFEVIPVSTGLYLGDRDTEPRMVIMGRAKLELDGEYRYLNYLNVHLNTFKDEREGNEQLDQRASISRQQQVGLILENIVSAYQQSTHYRMHSHADDNKSDIWIIAGDFNCTPDSAEIAAILNAGFVDAINDKHIEDADPAHTLQDRVGTKWSINDDECPPVVLDHIFCGLEQPTLTSDTLETSASKRPFRPCFDDKAYETDHAVLFAKIRLPGS